LIEDMAAPDRHRIVALPPDTIAEGVRRLGWIALVYAIGYIAGPLAIAHIVHRSNLQMKDAREIGSYELIERIDAGAMGEGWQAPHRLLAWSTATKLIRSSMPGEN
jgi:hypothetical protein